MTTSIRFSDELTQRLEQCARRERVSKSEMVRRCVEAYLQQLRSPADIAWEEGKDIFGKYGSGRSDISINADKIVRERFDAKRNNR